MDKMIMEYQLKFIQEKEKYEQIINENDIHFQEELTKKEEELIKNEEELRRKEVEIQQIEQKQIEQKLENESDGMLGVIKNIFNGNDECQCNKNKNKNKCNKCKKNKNKNLGVIPLNTLNYFNAMNDKRRLISIYGAIFDVTKEKKFSKTGRY